MSNPLITAIDLGTELMFCKHRLAAANAALAGLEPSDVPTLVELVREMLCWIPDGTRQTPEQRGAKMETVGDVRGAAEALIERLPK